MTLVKFKVKSDAATYGVKIDDRKLKLVNGEGSMELEVGKEHILVWFMTGASGSSFSLLGKDGAKEVVAVKDKKIGPVDGEAGDYTPFKV